MKLKTPFYSVSHRKSSLLGSLPKKVIFASVGPSLIRRSVVVICRGVLPGGKVYRFGFFETLYGHHIGLMYFGLFASFVASVVTSVVSVCHFRSAF